MRQVMPLRYGVVFKKAFSKPDVFNAFVKAATGVPINVKEVFQEYEYKEPIGRVKIKYDLFAEDKEQKAIIEIQHIKESDFWDRFLYYHIMAMAEQVQGSEDDRMRKDVYTIVVLTTTPKEEKMVLTTTPKEEKMEFSVAVSEIDPEVQDEDKKGKKIEAYKHKIIFLNPKLVNEKTPGPIREWLELIQDSLDSKIEEKDYKNALFRGIIEDIAKNTIQRRKKNGREKIQPCRVEKKKQQEYKNMVGVVPGSTGILPNNAEIRKSKQRVPRRRKSQSRKELEPSIGMLPKSTGNRKKFAIRGKKEKRSRKRNRKRKGGKKKTRKREKTSRIREFRGSRGPGNEKKRIQRSSASI